jgi:hypothetical protein
VTDEEEEVEAAVRAVPLHPAPCTLHPAPCTIHPAPCTLHPAPCTLHPAPCTPAKKQPVDSVDWPTPRRMWTVVALQGYLAHKKQPPPP